MKSKLLLVFTIVSVLLLGCKSQDDKHADLYKNYLRDHVTFEYDMSESIATFYKADSEKIVYNFEKVSNTDGEEGAYRIMKISFVDKDIATETVYCVNYPEKINVVSEVDDPEIVGKLEEGFYDKLKEYDLSWKELDDFMVWYQLLSTGEKAVVF